MGDRKGDATKKPAECRDRKDSVLRCPNIKEVGGGMDGEQYDCSVCGERVYLDYDEMR